MQQTGYDGTTWKPLKHLAVATEAIAEYLDSVPNTTSPLDTPSLGRSQRHRSMPLLSIQAVPTCAWSHPDKGR